jgi:hypothetical protein
MARKSKHEDGLSSQVVEFAMANWDMQCTQSYIERGRQFENATAEDLQTLFVQAFRNWRADRIGGRTDGGKGRSRVQDVSSEYALRGVDPPFLLVDDDLDEIGSAVAEDIERMGPDKRAEMNSGLLDEYLAAQKSRN